MDENRIKVPDHTLSHSMYLLATVLLCLFWAISPYKMFATQIGATLLSLYIIKHMFREHINLKLEIIIDSVVLCGLTLVIVTSTGGLNSPVFFLIYFLLFALSLMTTPTIPLILAFALIIYFLFTSLITSFKELLPLASFPLITPLAVYFGKEHKKNLYQKQDVLNLKETIRRETEDVMLWLTTVFTREVDYIKEKIDEFPGITDSQRPTIKSLSDSTDKLKRIGDKLKQAIEED